MKLHLSATPKRERQLFDCFPSGPLIATEWVGWVPSSSSAAVLEVVRRFGSPKPVRDMEIDGVPHSCFSFGAHSDGGLCTAWRCFEALSEVVVEH